MEGGTTQVLIVGAGAAGLTLGIDLARRGVSFRLVEKLPEPFHGSRGKGIQPRSQEIFEDLGVLDRLVAIGGEYPPQREYRADGSYEESFVVEPVAPTPDEPYHIPLLVPQFLTERVLRERLAELGGAVEYGVELLGFEQDADGVTARLATAEGEETVRARLLVGTDGGRSFVRRSLVIAFPGRTLAVRAVVADVTLTGVGRDAWHRWNEGDMARQMSLCPLPGTAMFQVQAPVPLEGDVDVSAEGLTRMIQERTGRSDIVVQSVSWGSAYSMNARLADRYRNGRIFLAGDAAHTHPPTGGQGLNTSVQDAYNLGWKIAAVLGGAPPDLLDTYEEERRPVAAQMLGLATRLLDAAKEGIIRRGREVHQLDIGYPGSRLAVEAPERSGGILAGDRAPDASLTGAAGQPVRLFQLLTGPHWTLVGYDTARDAGPAAAKGVRVVRIGADGDLRDDAGHFAAAYGLKRGSWMLIRPDGYVGAIVEAGEMDALDSYRNDVGLGARAVRRQ
ncbi:FAD-dependent oxidoreductase [Mangrovibrevibacter kandeliae]|uniref:FAD-dependent oxidoreductase n=1 Tax=Mangrovibrevibacter kandeliae TaxID=2968473 RepID=UPI0021181EB9|nr:FAD-dependent oxidoreductase [Aurantimonas sp. CSK15Z-1]MCQ8781624.1 FAD-dependent oxidoreductase [Aurantimonas sp. CSK15Z-1]